MQPEPQPVVADPVTDRPASQDPHTAAGLRLYRQLIWLLPVFEAVVVSLWLVGAVSGALALGSVVLTAVTLVGIAPQLVVAPRLAREHSWRVAPARVVGATPLRFAVEAEGRVLVLSETISQFGARVVARTGRVWLAGPDASGKVLARLDGMSAPLPGKVGSAPGGAVPVDAPGAPGTAAADALSLAWARKVALQVRLRIWAVPVLTLLVVLPLLAQLATPNPADNINGVVLLLGLLVLVWAIARVRQARRWQGLLVSLPALLAAGPWQHAVAALGPWRLGLLGTADVEATLNGVPVRLVRANRDLLANVEGTGALWFAGELKPGAVVAVGFPGFPVLGVAVCGTA